MHGEKNTFSMSSILNGLTAPFHHIADTVSYRKIQLLAGFLLVTLCMQFASVIIQHNEMDITVYIIGTACNILAYLISRTRYFQYGALLWGLTNSGVTLYNFHFGVPAEVTASQFFMVFSLIIPSFVCNSLVILAIGAFNVIALHMVATLPTQHTLDFYAESQIVMFHVATTLLIIGTIKIRDHIEKLRLHAVSDSEKFSRKLEAANNITDSIISSSPIGIAIYDENGQCILANQAIATIVGGNLEELLKQNYHKIESWKKSGLYDSALHAVEHKVPVKKELKVTTTFNKQTHLECNFVSFHRENHGYLLIMAEDITARKLTEGELLRYKDNLEQLVTERTEDLERTQKELIEQHRLATLGKLTATVSHEIRNPLGAIKTSLYMLKKVRESGDNQLLPVEAAAIARMNRNIDRCDQIIDELLDFTRTHKLNLIHQDLNAWLKHTIDEMNLEIPVTLEFPDSSIFYSFDSSRMERALSNIITNAVQAMEENHTHEPRLLITTRQRQDQIQLSISDNGPGIPADVQDRIFEPLFSTKPFGIGLGMPAVQQIVQLHHGDIEIVSAPGSGTTVTLWLPVRSENTQAIA